MEDLSTVHFRRLPINPYFPNLSIMDEGEIADHNMNPVLAIGFPPPATVPAPEPEQRMEILQIPRGDECEVDFVNKMVKLAEVVKAGHSLAAHTDYQAVEDDDQSHIFALVEGTMTPSELTAFRAWNFGRGEQPPLSEPAINWAEPPYMRQVPRALHDSSETLARYIERVCVLGRGIYPQYLGSFRLENIQWLVESDMGQLHILPLVDAVIKYREVMSKYPALVDGGGEHAAELKTIHRIREVAEVKVGLLRKAANIIKEAAQFIDTRWDSCLEEMKRGNRV